MAFTTIIPYLTPDNYVLSDSSKIEISGGYARLKDIRPSGYNLWDTFSNATDADYGVGTLTRTLYGGATVSGGELDCSGGTPKRCTYNADNFSLADEITLDFKFKPDFNNTPGETVYFVHQANPEYIQIYMQSTGSVTVRISDGAGYVINRTFAKANWVANQQYRMVLFVKSGDSRCYLDGVSQWTDSGTWTKAANSTAVYIGNNSAAGFNGRLKFDDIYIGNSVDYSIPDSYAQYSTDNPYVTPNDVIRCDKVTAISETATKPSGTEIKYVVKADDTWYYISGGTLTETDGETYAESNTKSEWDAIWPVWDPDNGVDIQIRAFLHSDDGSARSLLDENIISYDFYGDAVTTPTVCKLYGNLYDNGSAIEGVKVTAQLEDKATYNSEINSESLKLEDETTSDGYYQLSLVPNTLFSPNWLKYLIRYEGENYFREERFTIPNQTSVRDVSLR